jgi:transcriptional regulator with XRE-family HTH domain
VTKRAPKATTPVDAYVGARIRMRRVASGISQTELGEKCGVTFQQVQKYEKGTNRVSVSRLQAIAEALGVSTEFFYIGAPGASGARAADDGTDLVVQLLGTTDGLALAKAYLAIPDLAHRRTVLQSAEAIAAATEAGKAGRAVRELAQSHLADA